MEIELGIVSSVEIDAISAKARVLMTTRDNAVSPPLFVVQMGTHENKSLWLPKVDEQVVFVLTEQGKSGFIFGAVYSKRDETHADLQSETVSGTVFADGSRVFFDESTSELIVDARSKVTVTADDEITATVDSCQIKVTPSEIVAKKGTTQVKVAGKVSIKTAAGSLFTILDTLITQMQAEIHPTAVGPSGPPVNAPAYAAQQVILGLVMEA
jgi:phage baseplate assembly protein V